MHDYVAPFREIAGHFGLTLWAPTEGEGLSYVVVVLDGTFEGTPVHVYRATSKTDARYTYVWVSARRTNVGDLGLSIGLSTAVGSLFARIFGTGRIRVDDDTFDRAFAVRGSEPDRVRRFL